MPFTADELEEMRKADAEIDAEFDSPELKRRLRKAEYNHEYYLKNREKIHIRNKAYEKSHLEKRREHCRKYQHEHAEKYREYAKNYYYRNLEECRERARNYQRCKRAAAKEATPTAAQTKINSQTV